ncbi:hypothetical protein O181_054213 [Austropuccinia psidii MF-1]|uniref:Uncharacterized protein n=1 Tax=Austropuccinia psidii MF-1 TaxID=1389203 RepID=A0A9Q3E8W8_9BASI|nr:hypothetical protein [Austropuccinia psidii MF-1]
MLQDVSRRNEKRNLSQYLSFYRLGFLGINPQYVNQGHHPRVSDSLDGRIVFGMRDFSMAVGHRLILPLGIREMI